MNNMPEYARKSSLPSPPSDLSALPFVHVPDPDSALDPHLLLVNAFEKYNFLSNPVKFRVILCAASFFRFWQLPHWFTFHSHHIHVFFNRCFLHFLWNNPYFLSPYLFLSCPESPAEAAIKKLCAEDAPPRPAMNSLLIHDKETFLINLHEYTLGTWLSNLLKLRS